MIEDLQSRQAGDARLRVLSSGRIATAIAVGCGLTVICTVLVLWSAFNLTPETGAAALSNDFRIFWAAGSLALKGEYLAVFDTRLLTAVHNVDPEDWMPWLYPPGFLVLLAPFGALSYASGLVIMTGVSLVCITLALRPFVTGSRTALVAFALAPAYLPILVGGQNGLVWLAGLLAALAALRDKRWVLAGLFIGLLTLKPQFGLLVPVALLAAGLWRTTLVATLTAVIVATLPTLATGPEYWGLMLQQMAEHGQRIVASIRSLGFMASPFSLFVRLGAPPEAALTLQLGVTLAAALAVGVVWRSRHVAFDVKAAALLSGSLLASPYAWHYEAAIMAPVGLFLLRSGVLQAKPSHFAFLAVLWLGAAFQALVDLIGDGNIYFRWAFMVTPAMAFCLVLCVARLRATERPSLGAA